MAQGLTSLVEDNVEIPRDVPESFRGGGYIPPREYQTRVEEIERQESYDCCSDQD